MTKSTRVSWSAYYCTKNTTKHSISKTTAYVYSIVCPVCSQHFDNVQFIRHIISHLLTDGLNSGTLMSHKFCPECLKVPEHLTIADHYKLHRHVENIDPLALFNGNFVCPICERIFSCMIKFATHLYERHSYQDSPYVCTICYSFRSSYYCELLSHFHSDHQGSNDIFCPYCLKYFELPLLTNQSSDIPLHDAYTFYNHVYQHWTQTTYSCESCRLDFVHRKDLKIHDFLNHTSKPHRYIDYSELPDVSNQQSNQLCLHYCGQLTTHAPRVFLKCLECKERLRQPLSKHYNLMIKCALCKYTSSCNLAVNWHWNLHLESSIPEFSNFSDLKTKQTYVNVLSQPDVDSSMRSISTYDANVLRKSKERHISPIMFYKGILKCVCGFRSILCDEMARHLEAEGHSVAFEDFRPRLQIFSFKPNKSRSLRTSLWWNRKLSKSPIALKFVGLCQRTNLTD